MINQWQTQYLKKIDSNINHRIYLDDLVKVANEIQQTEIFQHEPEWFSIVRADLVTHITDDKVTFSELCKSIRKVNPCY